MAIPFAVDISAFYGEPDFREQDSGTIVDRRKTLNLHKEQCNQREGRNEERRSEHQNELVRRKQLVLLLSMGRPRTPVEPLASLRTQVEPWHSMKRN